MKRGESESFRIYHKVTKEQEGKYVRLGFEVPVNIQEVAIRFKNKQEIGSVIDLGLEDSQGLRGWSGGARDYITIREDWATPGYTAGMIPTGKWNVILGLFQVKDECEVEIEVFLEKEEKRWYQGDLHMHSRNSDGDYGVAQVLSYAKEAGLDFIALTDHNVSTQNETYLPQEDLVIIPGSEMTTYKGHSNFWGVKKPFHRATYETVEDVQKTMEEGKAKGAMISLNHPFCKDAWRWGLEGFDFEYVEIWNGPWSEGNQKAIDWWHKKLREGKRVIAVGGSDTHRRMPSRWYGTPTTWVEAKSYSTRGILEGIRAGRVCVSPDPRGPRIDLQIQDVYMGEVYTAEDGEQFSVICRIENSTGGILEIYSDKGLCEERNVSHDSVEITFVGNGDTKFYRVELWGSSDEEDAKFIPHCISNPIFIKNKQDKSR